MNYSYTDLFGGVDIADVIRHFIRQAATGNLKTKDLYPDHLGDYELRVSFGQGNVAEVPWIAMLGPGQKVTRGIYPVFLYYKAYDHLILAYGLSDTETPPQEWGEVVQGQPRIVTYMKELSFEAKRYGDSYVAAGYANASQRVDQSDFDQQVAADLSSLLLDYRQVLAASSVRENAEKFTFDHASMNSSNDKSMPPKHLNQILFGPPGTGKTYATISAALEIVDPEFLANHPEVPGSDWAAQRERRNALKQRFDELSTAGLIRFVTFHQSFSYEDFVEGLRAKSENGRLQYQVEDGVFKELADRSSRGMTAEDDPFDKALAVLQEKYAEADGKLTMETKQGKGFDTEYTGGHTFLVYPHSTKDQRPGRTGNLHHVRKLYETGDKNGIYSSSYVEGMLIYLKKECGLPENPTTVNTSTKLKNFVLIIDEINRGNVSRIFGELITLIEPSKRKGSPEALELVLPYSKETFSVPDNLYLLGTMNTADRSLAGLDIALRRRFTFREMLPKPELLDGIDIDGVDIGELLRTMNARIEVLLDADHCLGHAYFMSLKENNTLDNLAFIFRQQVLPLLQEYFFEDWERIAWVLNDQRKPSDLAFVQQPSADLASLFGNDTASSLQNRRWRINEKAFGNIESYRRILGVVA
jgi:5-methylcytosine-specific restriction protein B